MSLYADLRTALSEVPGFVLREDRGDTVGVALGGHAFEIHRDEDGGLHFRAASSVLTEWAEYMNCCTSQGKPLEGLLLEGLQFALEMNYLSAATETAGVQSDAQEELDSVLTPECPISLLHYDKEESRVLLSLMGSAFTVNLPEAYPAHDQETRIMLFSQDRELQPWTTQMNEWISARSESQTTTTLSQMLQEGTTRYLRMQEQPAAYRGLGGFGGYGGYGGYGGAHRGYPMWRHAEEDEEHSALSREASPDYFSRRSESGFSEEEERYSWARAALDDFFRHQETQLDSKTQEALHEQITSCGTSNWKVLAVQPHEWHVTISGLPAQSELTDALSALGCSGIQVELRFPADFPLSPPLARVLSPRMLPGPMVTFGGILTPSILATGQSDTVTVETWTPALGDRIPYVLDKLREALLFGEHGVPCISVDNRTNKPYDREEAAASGYPLTKSTSYATQGRFRKQYRCFSSKDCQRWDIDVGNKVLLPVAAVEEILTADIPTPWVFELVSPRGVRTYCGVLEFVAPPDQIILPEWMMCQLHIASGEPVFLRAVALQCGTHVKLQPHSRTFLEVADHKLALEEALKAYSCLSKGSTIHVSIDREIHSLNVLDVKPCNAVSLVPRRGGALEVSVDFAPPVDYSEPVQFPAQSPANNAVVTEPAPISLPMGRTVGTSDSMTDGTKCDLCGRIIPEASWQLHQLRCRG
eukprot:TRINITY_DN80367_c0_g1_i1.p1 TRINITY_DN80367_c0_g1~~TRINITY_DN80367_c0_g1_i1.p1  ORF type:complete len:709 (+),score=86.79 TRINITY_DN80367_c0_g1_i1:26-2128(+)